MNALKLVALLCVASILTGCAGNASLYSWGDYERDMYKYYKNTENLESLMTNLAELLAEAEAKQKVPPGLYAEYGYLLLESGSPQQAVVYFEKEKQFWPESTVIMDTLLSVAHEANDGAGR